MSYKKCKEIINCINFDNISEVLSFNTSSISGIVPSFLSSYVDSLNLLNLNKYIKLT